MLKGHVQGSRSGIFAVMSLSTSAKGTGFGLLYFIPWNLNKTLVQLIQVLFNLYIISLYFK